jgi:hypothetical protein
MEAGSYYEIFVPTYDVTPCHILKDRNLRVIVCFVCLIKEQVTYDRLCGLVARVLGYRSGCPGSIPGTTRKKKK